VGGNPDAMTKLIVLKSAKEMSRWPSWSKAPVSGTGPKGHGFESHS
jgi:hypothetical protein